MTKLLIKTFFENLSNILEKNIAPIGNHLDSDESLLHDVYTDLVSIGALQILVPLEYGGFGGCRQEWIHYAIVLAEHSGALLFLLAQHQFAINQLNQLLPAQGAQRILRDIINTNAGVGISLAANKNLLKSKMIGSDFVVSGKLPWVTGYMFFQRVLISFDYNNTNYYAFIPFKDIQLNTASIQVSKKIELAVFNSTNTVSISLYDWVISEKDIIAVEPSVPKKAVEHPAIYNFAGAAKALLKIAMQGKYANSHAAENAHATLMAEWQQYYQHIIDGTHCPLALRTMGLHIAEKCASFARITCGSAGVLSSHPLTRLSREIWQYTIAGYSNEQVEAYLGLNQTQN